MSILVCNPWPLEVLYLGFAFFKLMDHIPFSFFFQNEEKDQGMVSLIKMKISCLLIGVGLFSLFTILFILF